MASVGDNIREIYRRLAQLRRDLSATSDGLADVVVGSTEHGVGAIFDNGTAEIDIGSQVDVHIPYSMLVTSAKMFADRVGDITIDVWRSAEASFPPDLTKSITGSGPMAPGQPPTISGDDQSSDSVLPGWTTLLAAHDCLRFHVKSVSGIRRCHLILEGTRT